MSSEQPPHSPPEKSQLAIHHRSPQPPAVSSQGTPHLQTPQKQSLAPPQFQHNGLKPSSWTPDTSRKRARPTVSCLECRRKKLKCDRMQPCSQCVKSRREDLCQFATGVPAVRASRSPASVVDEGYNVGTESAAKRVRYDELTTQIAIGNGRLDRPTERDKAAACTPGTTLGRIYLKGNRSRYLGIGNRMAMLDHFTDAREYITTCFEDPETKGLMRELTLYQRSFQRKPKKSQGFPLPADRASLVSEMLRSLPTDGSFTASYEFYEMHWEGSTRVIHKQTFVKEAEGLFGLLKSKGAIETYSLPTNVEESLIPQVIGILAFSVRFAHPDMGSSREDQISSWMRMIQQWLDGLKGKERLHTSTLRTQILLLQLKINNLTSTSDLWKESGNLVRSAMIMGLHQDPERYEEISLFEKEQRRKLWRTVVELDLQFSLAGGMPTAIRSSDLQPMFLRNVDDFALKEDMAIYPENEAERTWTDALPQVMLGTSVKARLDATNILAGNINLVDDAENLLGLARVLEHSLQGLPIPSRAEEVRSQRTERPAGRLFRKTMLDVQLRRSTLCIYQSIMLSEQGGRYPEARRGAVRSAVAMLNYLDALDPEVADPNTIKNRDQLNLFHILCKKDIIQAALILCLEIRSFSSVLTAAEERTDGGQFVPESLPWTRTSLTRIVDNTLNSLFQRLGEFGSDLKDLLPLIVVLQSARSDGSPEDKRMLMRKGAERILRACRDALPHIGQAPTTTLDGSAQTSNSNPQHVPGTQAPPEFLGLTGYQRTHDSKHGFTGFNTLPGMDPVFEDFDLGFTDWDITGSWF